MTSQQPAAGKALSCACLPLILSLGACRSAPDFAHRIGAVILDEAHHPCLSIQRSDLAVGSQVTLIQPGDSALGLSGTVASATITRRRDTGCEPAGLATDSATAYDVSPGGIGPDAMPPWFAAVPPLRAPSGATVAAGLDLDGDGRREFFRICASQEGLHLTVWSTAPLTGIRRWHRYLYLGYDLEPNCTPVETAEGI